MFLFFFFLLSFSSLLSRSLHAQAEKASSKANKKKTEEEARLKAEQAAKASAVARETATIKTPAKVRRASLSEVKAAELQGNSGPRALILTSSIGGSAVESKERRVKDLFLAFNVAHEVVDGANAGVKVCCSCYGGGGGGCCCFFLTLVFFFFLLHLHPLCPFPQPFFYYPGEKKRAV